MSLLIHTNQLCSIHVLDADTQYAAAYTHLVLTDIADMLQMSQKFVSLIYIKITFDSQAIYVHASKDHQFLIVMYTIFILSFSSLSGLHYLLSHFVAASA